VPLSSRAQKSVLVVEDEVSIAEVLGEVLSIEGYDVRFASNGEEGLRALSARPDLVLVDALMPVLSGAAMIHAMKADPERSAIPVMLMSAAQVHDSGAVAVLRKPFEMEYLLDAIARLIGRP
jgi:CheY-like chemotaxis protein